MKSVYKGMVVFLSVILLCVSVTSVGACSAATVSVGDVTADGELDTSDVIELFGHCAGTLVLTEEALAVADYNGDTAVDTSDVYRLFRCVSGELPPQAFREAPSAEELEVFRLINEYRAGEGLEPLEYAASIQGLADIRAEELTQCYSHTRPDGRICFSVFEDYDSLDHAVYGENIAAGHTSAEQVMESWMDSEGHRANILNPSVTSVIVGCVKLPKGHTYYNGGAGRAWVQLFIYD